MKRCGACKFAETRVRCKLDYRRTCWVDKFPCEYYEAAKRTCRIVRKKTNIEGVYYANRYACSECNGDLVQGKPYCPNCGARIVGEKDGEQ